jgi:hypothetical protein
MSEKWTVKIGGNVSHQWNGYTIVGTKGSGPFRWWVIQGSPAPYKEKFDYINDAKEACEIAFRSKSQSSEIEK